MSAQVQQAPVNDTEQGYDNNMPQITMSRTAMAIVATLQNFALLLHCIMLENEQSNDVSTFFGTYANAQAEAQRKKGEDTYKGMLALGIATLVGAGITLGLQVTNPNKDENTNNDEINCLQNQKDALVSIRESFSSPVAAEDNIAIEEKGADEEKRPEEEDEEQPVQQQKQDVDPEFIRKLKDGQFTNEEITETRRGLRFFQTQKTNEVTPKTAADGMTIRSAVQKAQSNDNFAGTNDAAEIKTALDKKIDTLTTEINSKAQQIGGFSQRRQSLTSFASSASQGVGNVLQGGYQVAVGEDERDATIATAVTQQASSIVQTDQGQISNTFNLAGQTISGLGQLSANANS